MSVTNVKTNVITQSSMASSKSSVSVVSLIIKVASVLLYWACAHVDIILKCLLKAKKLVPQLSRYRCLDMFLFISVFIVVIYLFFDQFVNTIMKFATIPYIIATDVIIMLVYWGLVPKKRR